jgi:hypothetical protein
VERTDGQDGISAKEEVVMKEEKRIYVVLPAVVEIGSRVTVVQPAGRQVAQACHVVSKLRFYEWFKHPVKMLKSLIFQPITTIVLQARDTAELVHIGLLLMKTLDFVTFQDENLEAYGPTKPITALAVLAAPSQVVGILNYLPLWGS